MNKSSVKHKLHEQTLFVIRKLKDGKQEYGDNADGSLTALNKRVFNEMHKVSIENYHSSIVKPR